MDRTEKLRREVEDLKSERKYYEGLGFRARKEPKGFGFGGFRTETGEEGKGVFRGTYGPFLEKYFRSDSEEKRVELMTRELNKMIYGKGIPKDIAIRTLTSKIAQAQKHMEERGEFI